MSFWLQKGTIQSIVHFENRHFRIVLMPLNGRVFMF